METFSCNFCSRKFKTSSLLTRHKNTAKYCLKIQKNEEETNNNTCKDCNKHFSSKQVLVSHLSICKDKFLNIISDKDKTIKELQQLLKEKDEYIVKLEAKIEIYETDHDTIKEIAKQPKTQNNTINNNNKVLILSPFNLTQSDINAIVDDKFTTEHFLNGQKGVANFTSNNILKDVEGNPTYICTDASRKIFNFKKWPL